MAKHFFADTAFFYNPCATLRWTSGRFSLGGDALGLGECPVRMQTFGAAKSRPENDV